MSESPTGSRRRRMDVRHRATGGSMRTKPSSEPSRVQSATTGRNVRRTLTACAGRDFPQSRASFVGQTVRLRSAYDGHVDRRGAHGAALTIWGTYDQDRFAVTAGRDRRASLGSGGRIGGNRGRVEEWRHHAHGAGRQLREKACRGARHRARRRSTGDRRGAEGRAPDVAHSNRHRPGTRRRRRR